MLLFVTERGNEPARREFPVQIGFKWNGAWQPVREVATG